MATLWRTDGGVAVAEPVDTTEDARLTARGGLDERTASAQRASLAVAPPSAEVVVGPRPRASMLATISLALGVAAILTVLTGSLAGPGVAVGLIAAFVGVGGIAATGSRHVAGKADALLGLALGLAAVVVGILALTGSLAWLTGETDQVGRVRDWFEANLPWLLPSS